MLYGPFTISDDYMISIKLFIDFATIRKRTYRISRFEYFIHCASILIVSVVFA